MVTAISTVTGKVIDIEIMSKDCKECTVWRNKEHTQEWEGHQHLCQANHLGSSGSMDASGLLAIFQWSVESYAVLYTEFLGDGDSKAHKLIVNEAVYAKREVSKLDCVGHVQKRLGSRLRWLKKRMGQAAAQWQYWKADKQQNRSATGLLWQGHPKQHPWHPIYEKCCHGHMATYSIQG